ncbi:restriction endonuclease subunit S [Sulfuricurvum sp.]|uniref:restriction endonuclease subunit S n=1 Tax=Sulfuricurvum sp. TaxID=2025608 RepID=UPI002618F786|nr:restriction endonuclease subunit S [Sulfuricurvum sp.]MDD2781350.1 restriction endonuclease subunit S [Sulfuricurvum sp.]
MVSKHDWLDFNIGKDATLKARIGWQGLTTSEYLDSGDYILVTGTDFENGQVGWETCHFVDAWRYEQDKNIQLKTNDVLITKDGTIGKVGFVDTLDLPATLNSGIFVIRPKNTKLDQKFLYYVFTSKVFEDFLNKLTAGSTINHLYQKDFIHFSFKAPKPQEQKAIAQTLSDTDEMITSLGKLIAKKEAIKQGTMQQLLTGKKRLAGFSGEWEETRLDEISKITMGQSPSSSNYNNQNIGLPLIQGNADIKDRNTIIRNYTSEITKKAFSGDIIMSVRAPVGEIAKTDFDCCIGRGVCAIKAHNDFLYYYLIFIESTWSKSSTGSTFDSVNSDVIKSLQVYLPKEIIEQKAIAKILSDMDNEIETLKTKLSKTKAIKEAMMSELLTGKTRLTQGI